MAPEKMFPSVTGSRFFSRKSATDTSAPQSIPRGMKAMLATECSKPIATNALIGSQMPKALPHKSPGRHYPWKRHLRIELDRRCMWHPLCQDVPAAFACHSAMHTIQLQSIPRRNA
eukprot:scaffold778_cov263-Pinguiococcus_pyrenoidosus.AAC.19